jgi:hypothetical protein
MISARASADPLDHAARQVRRASCRVCRLQADHLQLDHRRLAISVRGSVRSSRSGKAMFSSTLKAENSAPCWNSMPMRAARRGATALQRLAQQPDLAAPALQAQDLAQQHRLAGARAADQRQHLAAAHGEVQVLCITERPSGMSNTDVSLRISTIGARCRRHLARACGPASDPHAAESMANSASTRITTVIEVTTDAVVPSPRLWVLGCTAGRSSSRSAR